MKVHEILRKLRREHNLTQQNIADEVGIDITTYNRYEKDSKLIQLDLLEKIAGVFGMTLSDLINFGDSLSSVGEPSMDFEKRRTVTVSIELDGDKKTVDFWIDKIRKINTAIA